jgi:hypothetical protein
MGLAGRCEALSGDFFKSVPSGDAYVLSHIICDWDENKCVTILGNCRKANPGAKVLMIEMVIPPGDTPHPGKILDLVMLACPGGLLRTEEEYAVLPRHSGYELARGSHRTRTPRLTGSLK